MLLRGGVILARGQRDHRHRGPGAGGHDPGRSTPGRALVLWVLGDLLGITTLAPACRCSSGAERDRRACRLWQRRRRPPRTGRLGRSPWCCALVGDRASPARSGNLYALGLVSLPLALLLWAAMRFSPMPDACSATILVVMFLSLLTGLGLGGFTRPLTLLDASVLMLLLMPGLGDPGDARGVELRATHAPPTRCTGAPPATRSPACSTAARSRNARASASPASGRARPDACCTSTSTTSSSSTIRPATSPATT